MMHSVNVAQRQLAPPRTADDSRRTRPLHVRRHRLQQPREKTESPLGNNFSLGVLATLMRFGLPLDIHPNNADTNCPNTTKCPIRVHAQYPHEVYVHRTGGRRRHDPAASSRPERIFISAAIDLGLDEAVGDHAPGPFFFHSPGLSDERVGLEPERHHVHAPAVSSADDPGGVRGADQAGHRPERPELHDRLLREERGQEAANPRQAKSITDHLGHTATFDYYADGNLRKITQVGGLNTGRQMQRPDRSFVFTYTTSDGSGPAITNLYLRIDRHPATANESTRLYSVIDPRDTRPRSPTSRAGQDKWKLSCPPRSGSGLTGYDDTNRITTVTAPLSRATRYAYNTGGQVTQISTGIARDYLDLQRRPRAHLRDRAKRRPDLVRLQRQRPASEPHRPARQPDGRDVSEHGCRRERRLRQMATGRTIPHISDLISMTTPRCTRRSAPWTRTAT